MLVGIPDKLLKEWLGDKEYIKPADEGEAVAIGAGFYLATKKPATVFMSADGLMNALNPLTSWVIPEKIKMNLVISVGRQEPQHKVASDIAEPILKLLKYDPKFIHCTLIKKQ